MSSRFPLFTLPLAALALLLAAGCQPSGAPSGAAPGAQATVAPAAPKEQAKPTSAPAAPKEQPAAKPSPQAGAGAPIRLGVIVERTGALAAHGEASARSIELFLEELNAQGGLLGRPVEAIFRDSKGQQDEAVRQARDLLLSEKVDFLIHNINSAECLAVSEVAKEAKRIMFSSCGVDDFTTKGNRYTFRVPNITSRTQGMAAAKYAADNLKDFKTISTIAHDFSFGRSVVDFFKNKMTELKPGVQFIGELWPKTSESDYTPYITTLQNQKPDVTFYFFQVATPFFTQAAPINLHKQTTLLSAYWGGVDDIIPIKQELLPEGAILGGYPWYAINTPENKQFVDKYRARTGQPPRGASYFQQMTLQFLTEAVKKAGTVDTEKVVDSLEGLEVTTMVGKARIRPADHQGATPLWVGRVKWDPDLKMAVLADFVQLESEQFLPSDAEIKQARGM